MGRGSVYIDDALVRKARKLTRLKTERAIVDRALELLVRSESRKRILPYFGTGIWKGDLRAMRTCDVGRQRNLTTRFPR
jgi:Arc/MetJ family transcription regulator